MTKTIDVRKPGIAFPASNGIRRAGKATVEEAPPVEKTQAPSKIVRKKSFVTLFLEIAIYDVKKKLGLVKVPASDTQQLVADFEKFEAFCKLARGER